MKRVVLLLLSVAICSACFTQTRSPYKQYIRTLCTLYEKDTTSKNSMNDAGAVLGKCMNLVDTNLRNSAMKEKNLFKTDDQSLIQFERLFAIDLVNDCPAFKSTMEKLSNNSKNKTVPKLPVLDTISENTCRCLEAKGIPTLKATAVANINECLNSSMLKRFDEIVKEYNINDNNQEILSNIGEQMSKMVMANCKFYLEKINPLLIKK